MIRPVMTARAALFIIGILLLAGCSTQTLAVRMAYPLAQGQHESLNEEADVQLAEQALPASLKTMEGLLQSDATNADVLRDLAEGFCGYSFSFVEDKDPARAGRLYERGKRYALRSLGPEGFDANTGFEDYKAALARMDGDKLPRLFWLSQCWGGWLMLNLDRPEALADVPRLEALLQRVLALDESYHYAGPHLLLGVFYGSRTKVLGGDPDKARLHFERVLKMTDGNYLLAYVLYAKTYAVQTQNRELFEDLLKKALAAPPDLLPRQRLSNEIARVKANLLLGKADDLF